MMASGATSAVCATRKLMRPRYRRGHCANGDHGRPARGEPIRGTATLYHGGVPMPKALLLGVDPRPGLTP